ncbi:MAG TPA: hypothetical protein VHE54_17455 [Puia sp.]|nr:hypothetical protein [Puia sp.]
MNTGKITNIWQLRETIRDLEHQDYVNQQHMRARVTEMTDRLKPINIVRSMLGHLFHVGNEPRTSLLRMAAGIVTSMLVKKFFKKSLRR